MLVPSSTGRLAGAGFSKPPTVASGILASPPPTLRLRPGLVSPKTVSRFVMNQSAGPRHSLPPGMAAVLYRCATTGQTVQVWFADDVPDDSVYISLRCPACARIHLVNRAGRTLMPPRP
jgi:hypothetical protein